MWEIKGEDNTVKATIEAIEYNGKWMEQTYVTATIESPCPVDFEIGDYIMYRGERFEINYDPGKIKSAPRYEKGDAFKYENVKFNSLADELTRCDFLDVVLNDNRLHFTGLPKFPFYGNVQNLADRMQANLDRAYGEGTWSVVVSPEHTDRTEINVSVDNIKVQGALQILVNDFKVYYTVKGRTVTIGASGVPAGHLFRYGQGNGLCKIEQNAEADQVIVTRVRAYGSTRNLPNRYYNSLTGADGKKLIPDNMSVRNLMLPSFPYSTQDPYIDSPNVAKLGIREGAIFFDGSMEGLPEIFPTIEGMTAEQLHAAGVPCNATGSLDVIVSAEQMTDNGVGEINEGGTSTTATPATFKVTLKDLGFDIGDHAIPGNSETPTLSFKTGMLGGRDFEIIRCVKVGDGYEVELNRVYDDDIKLWFPYASYNAKAGDSFVLLHIKMPEVYIKAAAQRMYDATKEWLSKNDYSRSVYAPEIDENFMARQHDEAMASGGSITSLHDTLKEGMLMLFEDEDLNVDASIFIDQLTINEGDGQIPTYEVVLKEEKTVGRLDKMQNQIDSLAAGSGSGGYNASQIRSLIEAYGGTRFLSRIKDDRSSGKVSSDKAFEVGNYIAGVQGAMIGIDAETGQTFGELDRLFVRVKAYFETLTIINAESLAGEQRITPGGGIRCTSVEELSQVYRCYFLSEQDGEKTETKIIAGDQAISQMFNAKTGTSNKVSNHRYWRLVTAVSNDAYTDDSGNRYGYIDLSKTDCESGSNIPAAGDNIVQFGNRNDATRQTAIVFSTVATDAPSIKEYGGINSYTLEGKAIMSLGRDPVTGKVYFRLGADGAAQYLSYQQDKGLVLAGDISLESTYGGKTLEECIKGEAAPNLLSEYSADGNDWHSEYADGDIYVRTSADGGKTWTGAMRFAGRDGTNGTNGANGTNGHDGKDGSYPAMQWAKNNSATTAPTEGWQDTPVNALAGEYVWMRTGMVIPPATAPTAWGAAVRLTGDRGASGDSAYSLDLDNEMVGLACDAAGTVTGQYPQVTAKVHKGGTLLTAGVTYSVASKTGIATAAVSAAGVVTMGGMSADTATVTVQAAVAGITLRSTINLYKVRPGADGTSVTIDSQSVTYSTEHTAARPAEGTFTLTEVPALQEGQYLWSRTEVRYSDGKGTVSYAVSRVGADGTNGADGADGHDGADGKDGKDGAGYTNNILRNTDLRDGQKYFYFAQGVTLDTSRRLDGRNSVKCAASGLTTDSWLGLAYMEDNKPQTYMQAKPGDIFTFSAWTYTENRAAVDRGCTITVIFRNGSGRISGQTYETECTPTQDGHWQHFHVTTAAAPAGTVGVEFRANPVRNGTVWFNGFKAEYGDNPEPVWTPYAEGTRLLSSSVLYAKSTTAVQPADSDFVHGTIAAVGLGTGDYLWSRSTLAYSDGTTATSYSVGRIGSDGTNGLPGAPGADGKSTYVHYAYANSSDGTSGFSTTYFAGALYVGVRTDNTPQDSSIPADYEWARLRGEDGKSVTVTSTEIRYQASADGTSAPSGTWLANIPTVPQGQYLWARTKVTYSDGSNTTSYSVSRAGVDGSSVTVSSTEVRYAKGDYPAQPADTAFTLTTPGTLTKGQWLWTRTKVTYSDGKGTTSYTASYIGSDGEQGLPGTGTDGKTTYVHFAYASGISGTLPKPTGVAGFSTKSFAGAKYIGICTDFGQADPTDFTVYEWSEYRGADGADAVVYSILPSTDSVTRGADGTLSAQQITCAVYKTTGASARVPSNDHTLTYTRLPDGQTGTLARTNGVSAAVQLTATTEAVVFELKQGSTVLDRERVPVLTDASGLAVGGTNLLRNSDFIDGTAYWNRSANYTDFALADSDAQSTFMGRRSVKLSSSGATAYTWGNINQVVSGWRAGGVYTISAYVFIPAGTTFDHTAGLFLRLHKSSGYTDLVSVDLTKVEKGRWVHVKATDTIPATGIVNVSFMLQQGKNGTIYLNSPKIEEGNTATAWSASPLDTSYLRTALQQGGTAKAGLMLATLLQLGITDEGGEWKVNAGMNGAIENERDMVLFAGGDSVDAALYPASTRRARSAIRADGSAYFCDNTVKMEEKQFIIGDNLVTLDDTGLTLYSGNVPRLRVIKDSVGDLTGAASSGTVNLSPTLPTLQPKVYYRAVQTNPTTGLSTPAAYYVGSSVYSSLFAISASTIPANSSIGFTLTVPLTITLENNDYASFSGTIVFELFRGNSTSVKVGTWNAAIASSSLTSHSARIQGSVTVDTEGVYYGRVSIKPGNIGGGTLEGTASSKGTLTGKAQTKIEDRTVLGGDGLLSVWGQAGLLVNEDGVTMRFGNYSLKVSSAGIQKTVNGTTTTL